MSGMMTLEPLCKQRYISAGQQGVLSNGLLSSTPARVSEDVCVGCPEGKASMSHIGECSCLISDCLSDGTKQGHIPRCSRQADLGKGSGLR